MRPQSESVRPEEGPAPFRFINHQINRNMINFLRDQGDEGCDAAISCSNGELALAHKMILAGFSDYFVTQMTLNAMRSSSPGTKPIIFACPDIKMEYVKYIIQFLYDGYTCVPAEVICDFMEVVNKFKIKGLMPYKDEASGPDA